MGAPPAQGPAHQGLEGRAEQAVGQLAAGQAQTPHHGLPGQHQAGEAEEEVAGLTIAGILLWSLPQAWDYVDFMKIERTAFLRLRFDWLFSIYVPFAGAVIIRNLRTVWRGIRGVGYDVSPHLPDEVESHV